MGGCESTHAVSRSPQRGGSFALCAWAFLHACLYVQHTAMQHSMWQKYGQHIQAVHAAQAWYTYIHACSHARTATRMRASSLHTHQICKRSTHAAVQHRVCTSIYIDMYACGLHVQVVQYMCICKMQTHQTCVCCARSACVHGCAHSACVHGCTRNLLCHATHSISHLPFSSSLPVNHTAVWWQVETFLHSFMNLLGHT